MHTYISGCTLYNLYPVRAIVSTAATDVGMHGILASHHSVLPPCWFTLRASGTATLPSLHPSDFDRNLLRSEDQCSQFKFIIAKCSQKELPYTFREREGFV